MRLPIQLGALGILAVVCAAATGCGSSTVRAPSAAIGASLDAPVPQSVLNAPLTDENGRRTSLVAFSGKVVVLADAMTLCQEVCPLLGANLVAMARATEHADQQKDVEFVQLTVDPARDSPARLAAYRRFFAPAPGNWATLTGSAASIEKIWKFFGVEHAPVPEDSPPAIDWWTGRKLTYDVQHSDDVLFLDPRQHERFVIDAAPNTDGQAPPQPLNKFLSAQGRENLIKPDPGDSWTVSAGLKVVRWLFGTGARF